MIQQVRPDTVFVELCADRAKKMKSKQPTTPFDLVKDMVNAGAGGGVFAGMLRGFYGILELVGFDPGAEFKVKWGLLSVLGLFGWVGFGLLGAALHQIAWRRFWCRHG